MSLRGGQKQRAGFNNPARQAYKFALFGLERKYIYFGLTGANVSAVKNLKTRALMVAQSASEGICPMAEMMSPTHLGKIARARAITPSAGKSGSCWPIKTRV